MKTNRILMIVAIWGFIIALGYFGWPKIKEHFGTKQEEPVISAPPDVQDNEAGKTYPIKRIQVLKGDYFDITIAAEPEKRVLAKLSVLATEDSKTKVLDLMNHCTQPKVTLKSKDSEGRWVVDVAFVHEGKDIILSQWLTQNGLTYK